MGPHHRLQAGAGGRSCRALLVMLLVVFAAAVLPAGGLPPAICLQLFHA
jgi:hypothetical protein